MITMFFLRLLSDGPPPYTPSPAAQFIISQNWAQLIGQIIGAALAYLAWSRSRKNATVVDENTSRTDRVADQIDHIGEYLESLETADTASFRRKPVGTQFIVTVPPRPAPPRQNPSPVRSRHAASKGSRPVMEQWRG